MQLVPSVGLEPTASCSQSRRTADCAMTTYHASSGLSGSEEAYPSWRWSRWGTYPSPATGVQYWLLVRCFYPHSLSFLFTLPFGRDSIDRQESQPAFSLRPEMSAYRLHILRFRSSSRSMRFIFLVQKQADPIDATKSAAAKYHGMIQSGYPMQASSHIGRMNPKITTPSLRNGTAALFVIDVFLNVITSSLIFLRLRVLKTFSPDLFFQ